MTSGRTTRNIARAKPVVRPTMRSVSSGSKFDRTTAATLASRIQPMASSTAAAVMVIAPSRVRVMASSIMIRPRTGNRGDGERHAEKKHEARP